MKKTIPSRIAEVREQLHFLPRALRLCWEAAPGCLVAWASLLVIQGLVPLGLLFLTRTLVNRLVDADASLQTLMVPAAGLAGLLLLQEVLKGLSRWLNVAQSERVSDHIQDLIHERSVAADLALFESSAFYDRLHRAGSEAAPRTIALLSGLGSLLRCAITLLAMMVVVATYAWWLPVALLFSTLPALYVVYRYAVVHYQWWLRHTANDRRTRYFDFLLSKREPAMELRLFQLGDRFRDAWRGLRSILREERISLERRQALAEFGVTLIAMGIAAAAAWWMLQKVHAGRLSLGDLALFLQAFYQGQSVMRTLMQQVGLLYQNMLFLGSLFEYLALEPAVVAPTVPQPVPDPVTSLRFDGVQFSYPGSLRSVLDNFSLTIPAGKITAIVGSNGAGKSTLIKLLCRFYDPTEGHIMLNDIALPDLDPAELRRAITVLFQEPVHYHESAGENIRLGDVSLAKDAPEIAEAAKAAGAESVIEKLPDGYATELGKVFNDGMELSTGEWQRVALARAFLRKAPIILLDEPTSAMDSWAEAEWLQRFKKLAEGRTALVITHRFTTAMLADCIHVMEDGSITESGSHEELLEEDGRYAASWRAQTGVS